MQLQHGMGGSLWGRATILRSWQKLQATKCAHEAARVVQGELWVLLPFALLLYNGRVWG